MVVVNAQGLILEVKQWLFIFLSSIVGTALGSSVQSSKCQFKVRLFRHLTSVSVNVVWLQKVLYH